MTTLSRIRDCEIFSLKWDIYYPHPQSSGIISKEGCKDLKSQRLQGTAVTKKKKCFQDMTVLWYT